MLLPAPVSGPVQATPIMSVPHRHQRLHLCFADQPLGVSPGKQTSWVGRVGRPDPDASMVFQPLRQKPERLAINCRWAQSRLTCCVHVHTYSLARERLIYVGIVTDQRRGLAVPSRYLLEKQYKTYASSGLRASPAQKRGPSQDGPLYSSRAQRLTGAGCCWVRQWMLPPPKSSSRPGIITTSWSGKILARIALASASAGSSKLGAMIAPLITK